MPSSPGYKRNYRQEKKTSDARGEKPKRAANNRARLKVKKRLGAKAIAGKDVGHKNNKTSDNSPGNIGPVSKAKNRSFKRTKTAGRARG